MTFFGGKTKPEEVKSGIPLPDKHWAKKKRVIKKARKQRAKRGSIYPFESLEI